MTKFNIMIAAVTLIASTASARTITPTGSERPELCKTEVSASQPKRYLSKVSEALKGGKGAFKLEKLPQTAYSSFLTQEALAKSGVQNCKVSVDIPECPGYQILGIGYAEKEASYWQLAGDPTEITTGYGEYTFCLIMESEEEGQPSKVYVKENVQLQNPTESITLDANECTELIKFEPVLPNGEVIYGPTINTDFEIVSEGNITDSSYIYSAFGSKKYGVLFTSETSFGQLVIGESNIDWAQSGNFLVNPGVSADFQCSQMALVVTLEDDTPLIISNQTESLIGGPVSNSSEYVFTSYKKQFTVENYELSGITCEYAENLFTVYVLQSGLPAFGMYCQGYAIDAAKRIGITDNSKTEANLLNVNFVLQPALYSFGVDPDGEVYINTFSLYPSLSTSYQSAINNLVTPVLNDYYGNDYFRFSNGDVDTELTKYGNPNFSFSDNRSCQIAGDNVPYLFFADNALLYGDLSFQFFLLGRTGESPVPSTYNYVLEYNDEVFEGSLPNDDPYASEYDEWESILHDIDADLSDYKGKINLELSNSGTITLDGIKGESRVTAEWNCAKRRVDATVPTLTMLQFRNADGIVNDHFEDSADGVIMLSAADFKNNVIMPEYITYRTFNECPSVTVEYAPFGSEDWTKIEVVEDPDKFYMPGYGAFFSGSLESVDKKSPNGWMNLRISLVDSNENKLISEISPAFHVSSLAGINDVTDDSNILTYTIEGRNLIVPEGTEIFSTEGFRVNATNLTPGIYLLRLGDQTAKCIIK